MSQPNWKAELAASFSRIDDLLEFLGLPVDLLGASSEASERFPLRVTRPFAARIRKGDPLDPILRQVLPVQDELEERPGFVADPVGDLQSVAVPGLLHKYHGRALLIATGACGINCRYCFRREFPYAESQMNRQREVSALRHIAGDPSISEVILSGGDPLVLDDGRLGALIDGISAIPQVTRLRIHTRLPVVLPSRVTSHLMQILAATRLRTVIVVHVNHANELDREVRQALERLHRAGATLLNQSVLLKGVNDTVEALEALSVALFDHGVMPYYLHVLDKAKGVSHFDLPLGKALGLQENLQRRLPGYLVPRLVQETAGAPYKIAM